MAKKYYVVWKGREPGIFTEWSECKAQVDRFAGAKYKSFATLDDAESAYRGSSVASKVGSEVRKRGSLPTKANNKSSSKTATLSAEGVAAMTFDTKIFTDGGCDPNPGRAGSGLAVYRDNEIFTLWYGLFNPTGTNNTAELNALNQALMMAQTEREEGRTVAIYCDSKYSIQCVTTWAAGWRRRGWKKATGEIKNLELIKEMFTRFEALPAGVQILHVNGHVGIEGNELADRMSILAIETQSKELNQYDEPIDIPAILAMTSG